MAPLCPPCSLAPLLFVGRSSIRALDNTPTPSLQPHHSSFDCRTMGWGEKRRGRGLAAPSPVLSSAERFFTRFIPFFPSSSGFLQEEGPVESTQGGAAAPRGCQRRGKKRLGMNLGNFPARASLEAHAAGANPATDGGLESQTLSQPWIWHPKRGFWGVWWGLPQTRAGHTALSPRQHRSSCPVGI